MKYAISGWNMKLHVTFRGYSTWIAAEWSKTGISSQFVEYLKLQDIIINLPLFIDNCDIVWFFVIYLFVIIEISDSRIEINQK